MIPATARPKWRSTAYRRVVLWLNGASALLHHKKKKTVQKPRIRITRMPFPVPVCVIRGDNKISATELKLPPHEKNDKIEPASPSRRPLIGHLFVHFDSSRTKNLHTIFLEISGETTVHIWSQMGGLGLPKSPALVIPSTQNIPLQHNKQKQNHRFSDDAS